MDEIPAKCSENIARSTDPPEWACAPAKGGYTVHPVPAPDSTNELDNKRINDGGSNQNEILFNLGKAISTAPINNGTKKLPKPPTIPGMTMKKIIRNAWAVTIVLYSWASFANICVPGEPNSILINSDKQVPIILFLRTFSYYHKFIFIHLISLLLIKFVKMISIKKNTFFIHIIFYRLNFIISIQLIFAYMLFSYD